MMMRSRGREMSLPGTSASWTPALGRVSKHVALRLQKQDGLSGTGKCVGTKEWTFY